MLEIDIPVILAQLATFLIAAALLWRFVMRPAAAHLRARADRIENDLRQAEEQRRAMEDLKAQHEQKLAQFARETEAMMRQAVQEGRQARDAILAEAQRQSENIIRRGEEQLAIEKARIVMEVRTQVVELATQLTQKMLAQQITPTLQAKLLDEMLAELENKK